MHILAATIPATSPDAWVLGMTPEAWLTVAAIFFGPIIALALQRGLDARREKRNRRMWVFRELMVTRGTRVSPRHVEAFNTIGLEFKDERKVMEAWDKYFELFIHANPEPSNETEMKAWTERGNELLAQLLYQIAEVLDYEIGEVDLRKKVYYPRAHGDAELEANAIRRGLAEVMFGLKRFPIDVDFCEEFKDFLASAAKQGQAKPATPPMEAVAAPNTRPTNLSP